MQTAHATLPVRRQRAGDVFWRAIYFLSIGSFILPFVLVEGCTSSTPKAYTGVQLIGEDWLFLIPPFVGALFLILSFLHQRYGEIFEGFAQGCRTLLASSSLVVVLLLPQVRFLFEAAATPLQGQIVAVAAWLIVYGAALAGLWGAFRRARSIRSALQARAVRLARALRAATYVLIVLGVILPVGITVVSPAGSDRWLWLILAAFNIPAVVVFWFAAQGASHGEQWVRAWAVPSVVLLLVSILAMIGPGRRFITVGSNPTHLAYNAVPVWLWFAHLSATWGLVVGYLGAFAERPAQRDVYLTRGD